MLFRSWFNGVQDLKHAEVEQFSEEDKKSLTQEATTLLTPVHPKVVALLKTGNLIDALSQVGEQTTGRMAKLATKLSTLLTNTKVEFISGLKNDSGKVVSGLFDPKTNTIKLNSDVDFSLHTLLHESVHAAVSHIIANKGHPVTKQLTELYNNVKDVLDTAYGAKSLDEFIAEAMSNPEFQTKLNGITPKGEPITAWQRFTHAIKNYVRTLIGMPAKGMNSALDVTDVLVDSVLSTAPDMRTAGALYSASVLGRSRDVIDAIAKQIGRAHV